MTDEQVTRVAEAIKQRREELIAQPLSRIYEHLARAAIAAIEEAPSEGFEEGDGWI